MPKRISEWLTFSVKIKFVVIIKPNKDVCQWDMYMFYDVKPILAVRKEFFLYPFVNLR